VNKEEQLNEIKQRIISELKCPLKDAATNLVFGKGSPNAKILFIGEAPGHNEDLQGLPFVGAAGRELDKLLNSIGLSLSDAYIANILKYRPPENRNPTKEEISNHTPFLVEQIKAIQPRVICTLGNFSTKFVLAGFQTEGMEKIEGITKIRGQTFEVKLGSCTFKVIPIFHPAAILYKPQWRKTLEEDFFKIKALL
jgi:uracil-DNA glycosylase